MNGVYSANAELVESFRGQRHKGGEKPHERRPRYHAPKVGSLYRHITIHICVYI